MSPENIILITSTILTFIVSIIDLLINSYAHNKAKHINLICSKCCEFEYDSENENQNS